ncbi:TspO and MBR [Arthrobacter sp. ZBG10]|nr:TspO and MBR [Arthrobacter sp. ZBG10]
MSDLPSASGRKVPSPGGQAAALLGFLGLSMAAWIVASVPIILNSTGWFAASVKAPWMPPGWMFRSMWMLLYAAVALAAWLVWRRQALRGSTRWWYAAQLLFNAAWPLTFFGLYPLIGTAALWGALVVIAGLGLSVGFLVVRFGPVSATAGLLMLPYLSWVIYSFSLNLFSALHN